MALLITDGLEGILLLSIGRHRVQQLRGGRSEEHFQAFFYNHHGKVTGQALVEFDSSLCIKGVREEGVEGRIGTTF